MSEKTPPAKPTKDTVYLEVDDDITTIIDKVDTAKQKIVALVLPKRASALQSIVNMRLLARSAEKADKNIVLITSERALLPLAGAAGIHVAKNLQSKPAIPAAPDGLGASDTPMPPVPAGADEDEVDDKAATLDYHRSIGELAAVHASEDVITLDDKEDELPEPKEPKSTAPPKFKSPNIKVPNFERFRLMMLGGILLVIGLIVFIILALFVLPKATVTIQTSSIPVSANLTLNASDKYTTLNESANQIPASLKATKQTSSQQVQATGQQNNGNKASGTVTLSLKDCSQSQVTIPEGTLVSSGGSGFVTKSSATLQSVIIGGNCRNSDFPNTSSKSVSVIAQQGGAKNNLASGQPFTVQGYPGVSGANSSAFSGGTDNITTVVSQTDIDNAKAKVTSASSDDFTKKFEKQLSDQGLYVLTSTLKIGDPTFTSTPDVGQAASTANVTITITYTVLTVSKDDLRKVITDTLNDQIDKSKQKISNDDVMKGAGVSIQNQTGEAQATLSVSEDTTVIPIINTNEVKRIAMGKKSAAIQAAISEWPGVKNVDVKMSPFWVSKAPKKPGKIQVKLVQVKS